MERIEMKSISIYPAPGKEAETLKSVSGTDGWSFDTLTRLGSMNLPKAGRRAVVYLTSGDEHELRANDEAWVLEDTSAPEFATLAEAVDYLEVQASEHQDTF